MIERFVFAASVFFFSVVCLAGSLAPIGLDKPIRTQTVSYGENQINRELKGINESESTPNKSDLRCSYYKNSTVMFITWSPSDRRGALIKNENQNQLPKCDLKTLAQQKADSYLGFPVGGKYYFDAGVDYGKFTVYSKDGQVLVSDSNVGEAPKFFKTSDGKIAVHYKSILAIPGDACSNWSCSGTKDSAFWKSFDEKNDIPGSAPPKCLRDFFKQNGPKTNLQLTIPIEIDDLEKPHEIKRDFENIACEIPG